VETLFGAPFLSLEEVHPLDSSSSLLLDIVVQSVPPYPWGLRANPPRKLVEFMFDMSAFARSI
jgi:hypothetical protein